MARMEIDSVVSMCFHGKARWHGTYPKVSFIGSCPGVHICIDGYLDSFLLEFWMKSGKGFVGSSGNESKPNHASNVGRLLLQSMMELACLQFQALQACYSSCQLLYGRSARRIGCIESFQLQLSSAFFVGGGYSLNEYKLKARKNFQFKAYITSHVVLCLIL